MAKRKKIDRRALRDAQLPRNRLQVGTLCYKHTRSGLKILLVTSRTTRRWIGPKGWPMKKRTHAEAAAQETLEEAGVTGRIDPRSIGFFTYRKVLDNGRSIVCTVQLFALEVTREQKTYPEAAMRRRKWFRPAKAVDRADPPEFARMIRDFCAQKASERRKSAVVNGTSARISSD